MSSTIPWLHEWAGSPSSEAAPGQAFSESPPAAIALPGAEPTTVAPTAVEAGVEFSSVSPEAQATGSEWSEHVPVRLAAEDETVGTEARGRVTGEEPEDAVQIAFE